jgi:hypothetical protein
MNEPRDFVTHMVDHYLGNRREASAEIPGLREAVVELVTAAFPEAVEPLMRAQLDLLGRSQASMPDAYLADQAAVEDALQRAAAGLRSALAQAGQLVEPGAFESSVAERLRDDPLVALRAELARVPRPLTRPNLLDWSLAPAPWHSDDHQAEDQPWPPTGFAEVADLRYLPGGVSALARVDEGPHAGWVQIALAERHRTHPRDYPKQPGRRVQLLVGLEAGGSRPEQGLPPAAGSWDLWVRRLGGRSAERQAAAVRLAAKDQPLVALLDGSAAQGGDAVPGTGPGMPPFVFAPTSYVVVALGLEPSVGVCGFSLRDGTGEAVVCRQWRGHMIQDGLRAPLLPAVAGGDLLIRPDLFTRLQDLVGTPCQVGLNVFHASSTRIEDDAALDDD